MCQALIKKPPNGTPRTPKNTPKKKIISKPTKLTPKPKKCSIPPTGPKKKIENKVPKMKKIPSDKMIQTQKAENVPKNGSKMQEMIEKIGRGTPKAIIRAAGGEKVRDKVEKIEKKLTVKIGRKNDAKEILTDCASPREIADSTPGPGGEDQLCQRKGGKRKRKKLKKK